MICTFYSFKGGVGRTMALANVAELFYQSGKRVLMVDFDLEAPGLEQFFTIDQEKILEKPGIIDLLFDYKDKISGYLSIKNNDDLFFIKPEKFLVDIYPDCEGNGRLYLLTAGRRSTDYFNDYIDRTLNFNWQEFFVDLDGELYIEWLREEFNKLADVILIDTRTGFTEKGGVCTYQLADVVIMFCAPNQQNVYGTLKMARSLKDPKITKLRHGREIEVLIIPARVDDRAEVERLDKFRKQYFELFAEFIPKGLMSEIGTLWDRRIPHVPYYSFDEIIAVKQEDQTRYNAMAQSFKWIQNMLIRFEASRLKYIQPEEVELEIDQSGIPENQDQEGEATYQYLAKRYGFGYRSLLVQCIIENDGSARVIRNVEIEAYSIVSEVDTFIRLPEEKDLAKSNDVEPGEIESDDIHDLKLTIIDRKPGKMTAKIQILPPLKEGEILKYRTYDYYLPKGLFAINLSSVDLRQRENPKDYFGWHINRPTKHFTLQVQFPSGTNPAEYWLEVRYPASAGVPTEEVPEQEQRKLIKPESHLFDDRVVLMARIDYPLSGLIYILVWKPKLKDK